MVSKDWVFGGVERGTKRCFMAVEKDRSQQTLLALIKKYIAPGSIILSDCWKGYKNLRKLLECEHYTVNHTHYFKDPFTHTHTNTIEGTWLMQSVQCPEVESETTCWTTIFASLCGNEMPEPAVEFFSSICSIVLHNNILWVFLQLCLKMSMKAHYQTTSHKTSHSLAKMKPNKLT